MASSQKSSKPTSRWGFLQQAVASVESKLDTILADEEDQPQKGGTQGQPAKAVAPLKRASTDVSRGGAPAQPNDRLQERLARAMAKKSGSRPESPLPPTEAISGISTPSFREQNDESEPEMADERLSSEAPVSNDTTLAAEEDREPAALLEPRHELTKDLDTVESSQPSDIIYVQNPEEIPNSATPSIRVSSNHGREESVAADDMHSAQTNQLLEQGSNPNGAHATHDDIQHELNGYIERIDALQAKLLYLTKEAADSAKQATGSVEAGSAERKILEKDEKIALLMAEGQKLSKSEMKHLTTIRKLRTQVLTGTKENSELKARAEKAETTASILDDRARRAEAAARRAEMDLAESVIAVREFQAVSKERYALSATVADMKAQLIRVNARAEQAEEKAQSDHLARAQKRSQELQDELTNSRIEHGLSEEKLSKEIEYLKVSLQREKEHSRAMETEMIGEQAMLESRLESFRAKVEEVSSNDHGGTQAKLLRQIETLQTQYSSASQNWQGIEGTLLARITNLEKDRHDAASREVEVRKKLRDAVLRANQNEQDLDDQHHKVQEAERSQNHAQDELSRASRRAQQLEEDLDRIKVDMDEQRLQAEREILRRIDEEKAKWAAANIVRRQDSPGLNIRKISGYEMDHLMSPVQFERAHSRRSSVMPGPESNTPPRQQCATSFRTLTNGTIPETPSIMTPIEDDYFANVPPTPASQTHPRSSRGLNDILSTSTVGAGPSVQLVERISANVRRLESEKAASKDELLRLTNQRDEARQEVVSLMKEVEQKRALDQRLKKIEEEHKGLNARHRTTLEMLGEKSEMVEELKADIADVKQMYRELANTMK